MTPERWRKIEQLCNAAWEREASQRAAFLAQACGEDDELRREVESLLMQEQGTKGFLETPAIEAAAQMFSKEQGQSLIGRQIGSYQVLCLLGVGGMGEVYEARDTKLGRNVAIKVLPAAFVHDPERLSRFQREARMLASLNHPNIATIHGLEQSDGVHYLVMELVDGETLAERISKGASPLPVALKVVGQIAEALEAAHERGVIHRDLKPANVKVTPEGRVKVLDFGLAKVFAGDGEQDVSQALTLTAIGTEAGKILGTPAYMSPEQARGKAVDKRTDIWAFGCVLYELLTTKPAFRGETLTDTLAAVLEREPDWQALPTATPANVRDLLRRCLQKDSQRRLRDFGDARIEIEEALVPPLALPAGESLKRDSDLGRAGVAPAEAGLKPAAKSTRFRWVVLTGTTLLVIGLAVGVWLFFPRKVHVLTDKDTIVLADFINTTGDPVFDDTLRQGLAIQLEQSPFLKIMDDEQVQQDLRLMSLPLGARITNHIAHDICVRDAAAATINGSIASLGKNYVLTLQAITCQDGATLAREQVQAEDKEHVLDALGTAATAMRAKLGESLSSIEKMNLPLEQATTPSLEALQNYTAGFSEMVHGQFIAAVPFFERATTLDPNFAMAYFYVGVAFNNAGDIARSREYTQKALGLIDRVSEFERDLIAGTFYSYDGQSDRAIDEYRLGTRDYPREWGFHNQLGVEYIDQGQFEQGLKEGLEATGLQANVEPPYRRQLDAYMCLGRIPEAKELAEKLRAQGLGGARIHQRFLEIAYIEGDQAAAARETQWFAGKPEEYLSFGLQAANRNALGQLQESSKLYQRAAETARRQGLQNAAAEFEEADARADALSGNCLTVGQLGRPALALAMCGDEAQAEKLAGETSRLFPNGTLWNAVELPAIRAAIALKRDQPAKAVDLLASASLYERASPEVVYLRGLAYLGLGKGAEASAEFQKILDHKGANWGSAWQHPYWGQFYALSYLALARAYKVAGDIAKSRKAYQDFLILWKDADLDIPILRQAKAEYARLR